MSRPSPPRLIFQPSGRSGSLRPGESLLESARRAGVDLAAACGGKGLCGKCQVRPRGEATPPTPAEQALLGDQLDSGLRLACQVRLPAGGAVWVPEGSRLRGQVILTDGQAAPLELDPPIRRLRLDIPPPSLEQPEAARERLLAALPRRLEGEAEPSLSLALLRELPARLPAGGGGRLEVDLRLGGEVVALGEEKPLLGLALDLGTTTVAAYLCELATGRLLAVSADLNPQASFGDDVISRISACAADPGTLARLSGLAVECVNSLARRACRRAGADREQVLECVMVGNTAMHHLFLGLDPACLAQAPYAPLARKPLEMKAREAGLELGREAWLHWLPLKAGFVGADIVAAALAVGADRLRGPTLLMDLGTNGEMVLAAEGRMLACSTAAGPALEGGHIAQGMRGGPGAVERVRPGPNFFPLDLEVIGGGKPTGFCGSGLVSLLSCLLEAGILRPGGGFDQERAGENLRRGAGGPELTAVRAGDQGSERDLVLSAADVSQLQLAKAAIRAGAQVLLEEMGISRLEGVLLAGAFGNYLDPDEARRLGMFPPVEPDKIVGVGNAAGVGAVMALLSLTQRRRAAELARRLHYIELSGLPRFRELFVDHMPFDG